ncbi:MAG TPA: CapA family protein [Pseudonocardiaceae bacterium]|nr:CapA family protein [Pseudonocardiaceae bacterium]
MDKLCLAAVGDVFVERPDAGSALAGIRPLLDAADVVFGNFEGVLTDKNAVIPGASSASVTTTAYAAGMAGFDVMSLANNHAMDAGHGGLVDTAAALSEYGVRTVGAGANLADALTPVVVEQGEIKLAVIAVTAVLQHGAEARRGAPGVAPLRAEDCYQPPYPGVRCPGVPPRVISILDEGDWDALAAAIERAKETATAVAVSVHWGDHTRPWVLTDHERLCAELIADAGADLILGHHQHILRGMDFMSGVPVWFGLGHAAFDLPRLGEELANNGLDPAMSPDQLAVLFGEYGIYPRPAQPSFPFHPIARRTVVAVADLAADGVRRCGVVPCLIDGDGVAQPVRHGSADWRAFVEFLTECQARAGLAGRIVADTDWLLAGHPVVEFVRAG